MERFLNRRNIILFLLITAILFGLYEGYSRLREAEPGTRVKDHASQIGEIRQMVERISADSEENRSSARVRYLMARAESAMPPDPFCDRKTYRDWKRSKMQPGNAARAGLEAPPSFNYTGYLEDKGEKIAIINGTEYMAGEQLDLKGFIVTKIFPFQVVIENQSSRKQFNVPFQD